MNPRRKRASSNTARICARTVGVNWRPASRIRNGCNAPAAPRLRLLRIEHGQRAVYAEAATQLAREMVRRGIGLVFGGGAVGLMGVLADAVLAAGGHAIGVIPHALVARELAHRALPDLRVVNSMHDRKATMAALADAFVAMPGGFGTFEEFCEVVTWTQLGVHRKPCGLLNVGGFYDPLIAQVERGVAEGFIKTANRRVVVADGEPGALLDALAQAPALPEAPWISGVDEA